MPSLPSGYRNGTSNAARRHERIRNAELAMRAELKIETETHHFSVLFAGSSEGTDYYVVCRVANGQVLPASKWFADVVEANALAREWGERDGVQWFGR
jgi:hypothetical protein